MIKKNQFLSKALIFLLINLGTILVSFACNCSYPNPPSHKHPTFPPKPPKSKPPFIPKTPPNPKTPKHHPPHNPKPPIVKTPPHHVPKPPVHPKPPIVHPPFIPKPPVVVHPPPIIPKPPVYPPVEPNPPNPPVVPTPPIVKPPSPPIETPCPPPPQPVPCPPPPPLAPKRQTCPIDSLKLGACVDLLGGLIQIGIGGSSAAKETCCPVLEGLVGLDAAVCLCTTIKAKLLNINIIIPIALGVLVECGKHPPSDFQCPSS